MAPAPFCLCPDPRPLTAAGTCRFCSNAHIAGLHAALPYEHRLTQTILHRYKFGYVRNLAPALAWCIIAYFQLAQQKPPPPDTYLVPIPSPIKRVKRRGFSHTTAIATCLESVWNAQVFPALKAQRTYPQQRQLAREERRTNISGAFTLTSGATDTLTGSDIYLIDDVYTTGATLEEAARVLQNAGAQRVTGITFARASL